ncbi:MAG: carboxypeptidase-like regulatory domain-containing protein [bacterium]
MKKLLLLGLIFFTLSINAFAQERIITGRIFDEENNPLFGATVCQKNTENCFYSDYQGIFHLLIKNKANNTLSIARPGYKPQTIALKDSVNKLIIIKMLKDTTQKQINEIPTTKDMSWYSKYEISYNFQYERIFNDFSNFESYFGSENVKFMSNQSTIYNFEITGRYKNVSLGILFGLNSFEQSNASLLMKFKPRQYALNFGYDMINSKHFRFNALLGLKYNKYLIVNCENDYYIPLDLYLSNNYIDISIDQMSGFIGCNLEYKTYELSNFTDYIAIGFFGGFIFKINEKPWIYSVANCLTSDGRINMKCFNFGINLAYCYLR